MTGGVEQLTLPYDPTDRDDILEYARRLKDRSLLDLIGTQLAGHGIRGKGNFGQLLERHYFKYELNSDTRPDFVEAGLELKSTGIVPGKAGWEAKERLKLNMINFQSVHRETFDKSAFLLKNRSTLLVCYHYLKGQPVVDRVVRLVDVWDIPEEDLVQIEAEWNLIAEYVRSGRAHELSESITNYLGACRTGQGKDKDFVLQPFSALPAKRRAFSFKQPYVTRIVREFMARELRTEPARGFELVRSAEELKRAGGLERLVLHRFRPFLGLSEDEAWSKIGPEIKRPSPANKNRRQWLNNAILGVPGVRRIAEFEKAGIYMRSFPLQTGGRGPREDFPFKALDFSDLVQESWETSAFRSDLVNRFFVTFYRRDGEGRYRLEDAVFWGFPEGLLDTEVRETWVETVRAVRSGRYEDLPKGADTRLAFVRTHGRDSLDVAVLPNGREVPKVSFWLHRDFLQSVFEDIDRYPSRASLL